MGFDLDFGVHPIRCSAEHEHTVDTSRKDAVEHTAVAYRLRPGPKHDPTDLLKRVETLIGLFGQAWRSWKQPENRPLVAAEYDASQVTRPKRRSSDDEKQDPFGSWQDLLTRYPERFIKAVEFGLNGAREYARKHDDEIAKRIRAFLSE
jgi:hypothetical protein